MNLETLLFQLHQHRESISENLDESLCKELVSHIKAVIRSGNLSNEFSFFCGKHLSQFVNAEKYFPGDKLSESDVETYANEIIEAVEQPDSEESHEDKDQ
ncbi:hypothetical protein [Desulfonema magnum]|uniref:Uncharacterized protein n=1 Tax=Desulfonema magnum TaxID=45655 RepID=A0A975BLK2_9BACT|nr:hypothetical protein [Desulfonema magnum]QTA87635.1 Uncharacterized protein dnm_036690 [Desulfonema magnum]